MLFYTIIYVCAQLSTPVPSTTLRIIFVRSYSLSYLEDVMKYADCLRIMPQYNHYKNNFAHLLIMTNFVFVSVRFRSICQHSIVI